MRKLFKTAILGVSALALPFALAATVNADGPSDAEVIDTTLEYQLNAAGNSIRFISTMKLNGKTLDDITSIDMDFTLTQGDQTVHSKPQSTTTVYEEITGENGKDKVDGTYYAVFTITNIDSKAGWRLTPTFTYNFADNSEADVIASPWLIGGTRVYFTNSYNWDNVYAFLYKDGVTSNEAWPGEAMTSFDSEHGVYYIDYPSDKPYDSIIFSNNGGRQTVDLSLDSTIHSYSLGKLIVTDDQTKYEGLGSTCSTHTWSTDYVSNGATHYHVCEVCGAKSKITDNDMEAVDGEPGVYQDVYSNYRGTREPNRIYFQDSYYWGGDMYIHQWGGDKATEWPGNKMTYFTTDMWGRNIFYTDGLGDCQNMLFHNNKGAQTHDATVDGTNNAYYLGTDSWIGGTYNICEIPA